MDRISGKLCCGIAGVGGAIVVVIVVLMGYSSLEYTELGLNYSWLRSTVTDKGYSSGRYFLGPFNHFVKFPSTVVQIEFSDARKADAKALRSRTKDGLEVELDISFQYQMNQTALPKLYQQFGTDYEMFIINYATNELTMKATHFDAKFLITNRSAAALDMEDGLKIVLDHQAYVDLSNFQLQKVKVPQAFADEITNTENVNQDIQIAEAELQRANISQQTLVAQAQRKAATIINDALAQAQTVKANAEAFVNQYRLNQDLQAKAMSKIKKRFESGGKTETEAAFLGYLHQRIVRDHPESKSIISARTEF